MGEGVFSGFRLGILGIWFYGDFGLEILGLGFREYGFGIFWLDIWAVGLAEWFHRLVGQGVL